MNTPSNEYDAYHEYGLPNSGVTEFLFWGSKRRGADLRRGGGGGQEDGIFPITFIMRNQKTNGGQWAGLLV